MKKTAYKVFAIMLLLSTCFPVQAAAKPVTSPPIHTVLLVNNSGDPGDGTCDGTCTLRDAILAANAAAGTDSIQFNFSDTILLASTLPTINDITGLTITGPTGGVIISGGMNYRILIVQSGASLTLQNLTIAYGHYDGNGGAIFNSGTVTANKCIFEYNIVTNGDGGAIYNNTGGIVNIHQSTFLSNQANFGGAIENYSYIADTDTVVVDGSIFKNNSAAYNGGAIEGQSGRTNITNSTFTGNFAVDGAAVMDPSGWTINLENVTIAGNSASAGASVTKSSGGLYLRNTIVANPALGANCSGVIGNNGNNIDSGTSCGFGSTNDSKSNTNPLLTPLGNYGGLTQTFALNRTSPAIDGVTYEPTMCTSTDQRGFARPYDGNHDGTARCDIGAYESGMQAFLPLVIR